MMALINFGRFCFIVMSQKFSFFSLGACRSVNDGVGVDFKDYALRLPFGIIRPLHPGPSFPLLPNRCGAERSDGVIAH